MTEIIRDLNNIADEFKGSVLAIGNFDGVHKGHRQIISKVVELAKKNGKKSAVMTFEPHPVHLFKPELHNYRLSSGQNKIDLLTSLGVDIIFVAKFDDDFAKITATQYIENLLIKELDVSHIVLGYDFIFGHKREGNIEFLKDKLSATDVKITQVEKIEDENGNAYSSSKIRHFLGEGNVVAAKKMLGREYFIDSVVEKGEARGRKIGFPTINLDIDDYIKLHYGVYVVRVELENGKRILDGIANFGIKPTFGESKEKLEVFIFDFDEDIYDAKVRVKFIDFVRAENKFQSIDELKAQIAIDCKKAKEVLN